MVAPPPNWNIPPGPALSDGGAGPTLSDGGGGRSVGGMKTGSSGPKEIDNPPLDGAGVGISCGSGTGGAGEGLGGIVGDGGGTVTASGASAAASAAISASATSPAAWSVASLTSALECPEVSTGGAGTSGSHGKIS